MPTTESTFSFTRKLFTIILVFTALYFAAEFLIPLAMGGVLATLFLPMCKWLESKKVPKIVACLLCVVMILLIIAGVFYLIGWLVSQFAEDADLIRQRMLEMLAKAQQYIYDSIGVSKEQQMQMVKQQQSSASGMISSVAGSLVSVFTNGILTLVYLCLFLFYRKHIRDFILKVSPAEQKIQMEEAVSEAARVSQQYLAGLAKMIFCLWIMYAIGFSIIGVKNAIFFAILCGMLEIVPIIGNLTGTTLTLLASSVQGADSGMLFGIIITYGTVQLIQGWVLQPLIVGHQVKINPMITILALVVGEVIWGIPGIILAIPLIAMFKIFCDHIPSLKPYGFLFGETESTKEPTFGIKIKDWIGKKVKG
jgi:predicted PurR-regulated permease PerM